MQLEFRYELDDLRELHTPEAYAANPAKYRRRWIRAALAIGYLAAILTLYLWVQRRLPKPTTPASATPDFEPRTELLPALIPAFYVYVVYVVTLMKSWRAARDPEAATRSPRDPSGRVTRILVGFGFGIGIWFGIAGTYNWALHPDRTQVVLITAAPWVVLIVLMQMLGVLQRRGKVVGAWRTNASWRRPKSVTLDASGLRIRDALYRSEFEWTYFKRARETLNLLVLVGEGGTQFPIPKRAFVDPADLNRARALLQNMVPESQFLVAPGGFDVIPRPIPLPPIQRTSSTPEG